LTSPTGTRFASAQVPRVPAGPNRDLVRDPEREARQEFELRGRREARGGDRPLRRAARPPLRPPVHAQHLEEGRTSGRSENASLFSKRGVRDIGTIRYPREP